MVSVGSLKWSIAIEGAGEAKQQAKEVEEQVHAVREAMEEADETVGTTNETLEHLTELQDTLTTRFEDLTDEAERFTGIHEGVNTVSVQLRDLVSQATDIANLRGQIQALSGSAEEMEVAVGGVGEETATLAANQRDLAASFTTLSEMAGVYKDSLGNIRGTGELRSGIQGIAVEAEAAAEQFAEINDSATRAFDTIAADAQQVTSSLDTLSDDQIRRWLGQIATATAVASDEFVDLSDAINQTGESSDALDPVTQQTQAAGIAAQEAVGSFSALGASAAAFETLRTAASGAVTQLQSVVKRVRTTNTTFESQAEAQHEAVRSFESLSDSLEFTKQNLGNMDDAEVAETLQMVAKQAEEAQQQFEGVSEGAATAFNSLATEIEATAAASDELSNTGLTATLGALARQAEAVKFNITDINEAATTAGNSASALAPLTEGLQHVRERAIAARDGLGGIGDVDDGIGDLTDRLTAAQAALAGVIATGSDGLAAVKQAIGDALPAFEGVTNRVTALRNKFASLNEEQEETAGLFDKLNAKSGFLGTALAFVGGVITTVIGLLGSLAGLVLGGGILVALGLLAAAWLTNFGKIEATTKEVLGNVKEAISNFSIEDLNIQETIGKIAEGLGNFLSDIGFENIGAGLEQALKDLAPTVELSLEVIKQSLENLWAFAKPILDSLGYALGRVAGFVGDLASSWLESWREMEGPMGKIEQWESLLGSLGETIGGMIRQVTDWVLQLATAFTESFADSGGTLKNFVTIAVGVLEGVVAGLKTFWDVAKPILSALVDVLVPIAEVTGAVFGTVIKWLATLESEFGVLSEIVKWVTMFVAALAAIGATATVVSGIVGVIGSLVAVIGGGLLAVLGPLIALVSTGISVLTTLAGSFLFAANLAGILAGGLAPLAASILAIIAVVVALYLAWETNFLGIRDIVKDVISSVKGIINGIINFFASMFGPSITKLVNLISKHFKTIKQEVGETVAHWKSVFADLWAFIKPVWNAIAGVINQAVNLIAGYISWLMSFIMPLVKAGFNNLKAVIKMVWSIIESIILTAVDAVMTTITVFLNILQGDWEEAWNAIKGFFNRTWERIKGNIKDLKEGILKIWDNTISGLEDALSNFINGLKKSGKKIITTLVDGITGAADRLTGAVEDALGDLADYLPFSDARKGPLSNLTKMGKSFVTTFASGIRQKAGMIKDAVKDALGKAAKYLPFSDAKEGPLRELTASGESIPKTLAKGIASVSDELATPVRDAMGRAMDAVGSILQSALGTLVSDAARLGEQIGSGIAEGMAASTAAVRGAAQDIAAAAAQPLSGQAQPGAPRGAVSAQAVRDRLPGRDGLQRPAEPRVRAAQSPQVVDPAGQRGVNPADVNMGRPAATGGGQDGGTEIEVNVGGIEVGDQTLDLRNLSPREMEQLADLIAEALGTEVRNTIT